MANFVFSFTVCNDHSRISPCSSTGRHPIKPLNICRVILYWYVHFCFNSILSSLTLSHFLQWRVLLHALTSFYGFTLFPSFISVKPLYPTQYFMDTQARRHGGQGQLPPCDLFLFLCFACQLRGKSRWMMYPYTPLCKICHKYFRVGRTPPPPPPPERLVQDWRHTLSGFTAQWHHFATPIQDTIAPPLGMLLHNTGECRETDLSCTYLVFVSAIALWTSSWSSPFRAQLVWSPFSSFHHEYYRRKIWLTIMHIANGCLLFIRSLIMSIKPGSRE